MFWKFIFFSLFFPSVVSAYYNPGAPSGFVNDYASMLSPAAKTQLEQELNNFEKETKHEISVVLIPDLQGDTIENFAVKLFEERGIGKKSADNGVLFLIAKDNRQMRIEVGYGLEGALPDAIAWQIIDKIATPAFKNGDYDNGVLQSVSAIEAAIKGEDVSGRLTATNEKNYLFNIISRFGFLFFFLFLCLMEIIAHSFSKSKRWWPGGLFGAVLGLIIGLILFATVGAVILTIILGLLGLLIDYKASKKGPDGWGKGGRGGMFFGGGGFGGSGGGGFGGFGGGGSGGGGSSGRW
ncbi:MAG: TPM domain-containing protein [Candidatus Magasanikbacteria bacterium]|nr:TPM domain-containing protein [Candidatus Magasanikbacteria bacterium]